MGTNIEVSAEVAKRIDEAISAGRYRSAEQFVEVALLSMLSEEGFDVGVVFEEWGTREDREAYGKL